MTDHKSATSTKNQNNPFEGKPSFTDPSLPNWNKISSMIIINQMKIIYLPSTIISIHWIQSITKVRIFIWIFQFIVYLLLDVVRSVYQIPPFIYKINIFTYPDIFTHYFHFHLYS